jgi:hypothetical protein
MFLLCGKNRLAARRVRWSESPVGHLGGNETLLAAVGQEVVEMSGNVEGRSFGPCHDREPEVGFLVAKDGVREADEPRLAWEHVGLEPGVEFVPDDVQESVEGVPWHLAILKALVHELNLVRKWIDALKILRVST